jgi:hypothetical protein
MNRIEKKDELVSSAKLFEEEILEAAGSNIPRKELCDMVDQYIYYQANDVTRAEAYAVVDKTCRAAEERG